MLASTPAAVSTAEATKRLRVGTEEADVVGFSGIAFRAGGTEPDLSAWRTAALDEGVQLGREAAGDRDDRLELSALV